MLRAWTLALALTLGGAGCAPSPASPPPSAVLDATLPSPKGGAAMKAPLDRTVAAPSARRLITIRIPEKVVCSVADGTSLTIPLAFSALRPPFATMRSARSVAAHIAEGSAASTGVVVEGKVEGLFVRGVARAEDVALYANRISVFEGLVVPTAQAPLHVETARSDGLTLSLSLPPEIEVTGRRSLSGTLPCSVLGLMPESFDPFENFFGVSSGTAALKGARVPIARSAADKPAATLVLDTETPRDVSVLDRDKQRVKIAWEIGEVIVFGWVDATSLVFGATRAERFGTIGLGSISTSGGCCEHVFVCPAEVPLLAEQDGFVETVGAFDAGTKIRVARTSGDRHVLHLGGSTLSPAAGTTMLVPASAVEGCEDLVERRRP